MRVLRHRNVTLMVQIPTTWNRDRPCIVTATSSGSRGVYGAIGTAGEWGLKRGCAVAYADKGTGPHVHDLATNTVSLQNGLRADADAAGPGSTFTAALPAPERAAYLAAFPDRVAVKHAHSGQNPEQDWGRDTLDAVRFALHLLNEERGERLGDVVRRVYGAGEHHRHRVVGVERRSGGRRRGGTGHREPHRRRRGRRAGAAARAGAGGHGPARRCGAGQRSAAVRLRHAGEPLPAVRGPVGARRLVRPAGRAARAGGRRRPLRGAARPRAAHHRDARRAGRRVARPPAAGGVRAGVDPDPGHALHAGDPGDHHHLRQRLRSLRRAGQPLRPVVRGRRPGRSPRPRSLPRNWRRPSAPATGSPRRAASRSSTT